MDNDIRIHLDEISPEDTARLARGCKRLYLKIMAMPDGEAKLDAAWAAYQQRKEGGEPQKDSDRTPLSSVWLQPGTLCGKLAWTPRS